MYSLTGCIGAPDVLASATSAWKSARIVPLPQGLALLPLSPSLLRELSGDERRPARLEGFDDLTAQLEDWLAGASRAATIAYVEAEFFGGEGFQAAGVWRDGRVVFGPVNFRTSLGQGGKTAISQALAALGVVPGDASDEFDALGLGRCRHPDEWMAL